VDPVTALNAALAVLALGREIIAIVEKTKAEGRDMTDEELAVVQAGIDLKHNAVVAGLIAGS